MLIHVYLTTHHSCSLNPTFRRDGLASVMDLPQTIGTMCVLQINPFLVMTSGPYGAKRTRGFRRINHFIERNKHDSAVRL